MSVSRKKARIVGVEQLSPWVRCLSLEVEDGPLAFLAGQWVNLYVPTPSGVLKRAYSIASSPAATRLEVAVTLVPHGLASPVLHSLSPGAELELDGPHGFFTREGDLKASPALFVATGTGLCPLRSMLLADRDSAPVTLLFGCRTESDWLWREELLALERAGRCRVVVTLSRPSPEWRGRRGYVQQHLVELARTMGKPHVFVCGLNRMVSEVRALCKAELGYERSFIHSERYD